jgi:hypothetical protein
MSSRKSAVCVYADRVSIAACADEELALKRIAEDSAAKKVIHESIASDATENPPGVNWCPHLSMRWRCH